jgi:hypothetical protein
MLLIIAAVAIVIYICLGGFLMLAGFGMERLFGDADLIVETTYPSSVALGQTLTLTASVRSTSAKDVTLTEIQLPKSLLEGFDVLGSDPPAGPPVDYAGQVGYPLAILIPPGQTRTVTFQLKAVLPGEFTGSLRAMLGTRPAGAPVTIRVDPAPQSHLLPVHQNQ